MSSSQNSASMLLKQHETKTFTKFDMTFMYGLCTETRPEWVPTANNDDGVVDWQCTDNTVTSSYVDFVQFQDKEECITARAIILYSTPDGPIMGISSDGSDEYVTLLDPCIVHYDQRQSRIKLLPIFNVARTLKLSKQAIRALHVPAELLIAAYPGFLIQNRMAKYQLKEQTSMASTPVLVNGAV